MPGICIGVFSPSKTLLLFVIFNFYLETVRLCFRAGTLRNSNIRAISFTANSVITQVAAISAAADAFTGTLRLLDKCLWFIEAHLSKSGRAYGHPRNQLSDKFINVIHCRAAERP
jgi:hypothetical protein